jgi:photosystem II stability/assembly factor-like uncharacterized protein
MAANLALEPCGYTRAMQNHLRNPILIASATRLLCRGALLCCGALFCCGSTFGQKSGPVGGPSQSLTWTMQESGTTAGLRGIDSVDGKTAWASGTSGTVLRTTDGGEHWTKCAVPDGATDGATLDFRGVQAWDAQTAIVMSSGSGDKSRLYKTTDGCRIWILLYVNPDKDGFWDAIIAQGGSNFLILGDPVNELFTLFDTHDGGKTWDRDDDAGLKSNASEGAFAASNSSLAGSIDWPEAFGTGGPSGARFFRQCSVCKDPAKWSSVPVATFPASQSAGIFSLKFRGLKTGVAVGGDYTKPNENAGSAVYSADGGEHWTAATKMPHGFRSSVAWSDDLKAWIAAGTNGSDISRDDGKTWQPIDDGNWNALSLPFVVGPKGRIARLSVLDKK